MSQLVDAPKDSKNDLYDGEDNSHAEFVYFQDEKLHDPAQNIATILLQILIL